MYSWDKAEDRAAIAQMNSELQHAQLELLSAHCATHQLRLRFSVEDLARYGERDVLRKSAETASALSEYYSSLQGKIRSRGGDARGRALVPAKSGCAKSSIGFPPTCGSSASTTLLPPYR